MGAIQLKNVTKKFGDQMVIDDLNLSIEDGSFTDSGRTVRLWKIHNTAYDHRT